MSFFPHGREKEFITIAKKKRIDINQNEGAKEGKIVTIFVHGFGGITTNGKNVTMEKKLRASFFGS
jgi:hypothetical protein